MSRVYEQRQVQRPREEHTEPVGPYRHRYTEAALKYVGRLSILDKIDESLEENDLSGPEPEDQEDPDSELSETE